MKKNFNHMPVVLLAALVMAVAMFSFTTLQKGKEIGIQLYSLRDDMKKDPKATVKKVGEMGYKFVEAAGYSDGKFYGMEPTEFTKLVEASGMKFVSSHTGQDVPDSTKWNSSMEWWDKCIAAHKAAGVKYIVQPWMGKVGYESLAGLKRYVEYFNAVGEKCNKAGIKFGYHNHDKEFGQLEGVTIYDYMVENTDPKKVFFQLDLYWITEGGKSAVDYFNKYPGRFDLWHVKDEAELGGTDAKMDFKPIFESAGKAGMKHYIVEVEKYNFEPAVSVKKSYDFLNSQSFVKK